jgi:hypothetical protein
VARSEVHDVGDSSEFLTHKTTCAIEILEKTTCQKICQKRPPTGGGTYGHVPPGLTPAWGVPPQPTPARLLPSTAIRRGGSCHHCQIRQACATSPCRQRLRRHAPSPSPASLRAGLGDGGTATCRLAKRAATRRGSFLTKIFVGGLF